MADELLVSMVIRMSSQHVGFLATRNVTESEMKLRLSPIPPKLIENILDKVLLKSKEHITNIRYSLLTSIHL